MSYFLQPKYFCVILEPVTRIECWQSHRDKQCQARTAYTLLSNIYCGDELQLKTKLHGLSPRANYTDRATAACRRSDCQLLRIEGAMWSA
jgi:hypothetical protein